MNLYLFNIMRGSRGLRPLDDLVEDVTAEPALRR